MADRSGQLILNALSRAAADGGVPLHGGKSTPGLFPTTALGRQAAQRCQDEGLLGPAGDAAGCTLTEKGLAYLLQQRSPRQVLEDFVRALEQREAQVSQLLDQARQLQAALEGLRGHLGPVLAAACKPAGDLKALFQDFRGTGPALHEALLGSLRRWSAGAPGDCPLPVLFRQALAECPGLSLGAFQDALRVLHQQGRLYLHPWTGPLYDLPEPACALLVGHEVAYYASLRPNGERGMSNGE